MAFVTVAAILGLLCYRIHEMFAGEGYRGPDPPVYRQGKYVETEDGWKLLWATGPTDVDESEWFDVTESPLDSLGYQFGIGKDSIRAIDNPEFVSIDNTQLLGQASIRDALRVIGYSYDGQAKACPIGLMTRHELVNDTVGGKPVTLGW